MIKITTTCENLNKRFFATFGTTGTQEHKTSEFLTFPSIVMSTNVITRTWLQLYYYEYNSQATFDVKDVNLNSLEYFTYFRGLRL